MAGAGLSVDSGIPDFVDIHKALPEISHLDLNVFEISNDNIFLKDPKFAWGVYGKRMDDYRKASPHEGYYILLRWCLSKTGWWVYTSNIDQHFVRAGFPKDRVVECHRSLYEFQCAKPCCGDVWDGRDVTVDYDEATLAVNGDIPTCRHCGDAARPCTVLAVDTRWLGAYTRQQEERMDKHLADIPSHKSIVILEIGCGVQMRKYQNDFISEILSEPVIRSRS
nr:NAD-dependent protein deacylase-like [Lytechinus pictus]